MGYTTMGTAAFQSHGALRILAGFIHESRGVTWQPRGYFQGSRILLLGSDLH